MFLVDVSRSMRASASPEAPTRLDQARDVVRYAARLGARRPHGHRRAHGPRAAVHLSDGGPRRVRRALERSVRAESPPPEQVNIVATRFAAVPRSRVTASSHAARVPHLCARHGRRSPDQQRRPRQLGECRPEPRAGRGGASTGSGQSVDPAVSGVALAGAGLPAHRRPRRNEADRLYLGPGGRRPSTARTTRRRRPSSGSPRRRGEPPTRCPSTASRRRASRRPPSTGRCRRRPRRDRSRACAVRRRRRRAPRRGVALARTARLPERLRRLDCAE